MGGIVTESFVRANPDAADAIILLGSWLPDLGGPTGSNEYPMPVLAMVGTLDGGGISYVAREFMETEALEESVKETTFTVIVEDVNHGQVN